MSLLLTALCEEHDTISRLPLQPIDIIFYDLFRSLSKQSIRLNNVLNYVIIFHIQVNVGYSDLFL